MGDLTAVNDVINGGWQGWVQDNASKVVTNYLNKAAAPATGVTATSSGLVAPAPAASGKTIAGIPLTGTTMVIAGVAIVALLYFLK